MNEEDASKEEWIKYNPLTYSYETKDGTTVGAELIYSAKCLADVLHIAKIRHNQRISKQADRANCNR